MSNEELVKLIQDGIEPVNNMEQLYKQNIGYIKKIANRYKAYEDFDDLIQEAYFGLHEAVKKYENTGETLFMSYASFWIRQAMTRYIENNGQVVRIPSHTYQRVIKYKRIISAYKSQLDRKPTDRELEYHLEVSNKVLKDIEKSYHEFYNMRSTDEVVSNEEDSTQLGNFIPDSSVDIENDVVDYLLEQKKKTELWQIVARECSEEESTIINAVYKTNKIRREIGKDLGITEAKVRSHHDKAIRKLSYPRVVREMRNKFEIISTHAYRGSVNSFNTTWTSSTERVALKNIDLEQELLRELMR